MAHQQPHGHATTGVDAYGNPVAPVHGVGHAPAVTGGAPVAGTGAQVQPVAEQRSRGILHRSSSSSSSSSSEDDGMGGRRKKGIKEKIKEKLPGGRKGTQQQTPATTGAGAYGQQGAAGVTGGAYGQQGHAGTYGQPNTGVAGTYGQPHAGVTDTYGQHGHTGTTGTYGQPHAGTTGTYGQPTHAGVTGPVGPHGTTAATGEKKGLMDKIKDKLPGHH
ncbi:hypothetical protein EJB05_28073, partial [Eragrostis curvula]